jgi:hypothetical protein
MPDSPIRTIRGMGGPRSLKAVTFETKPLADGKGFECTGMGGAIRGVGRTPELAIEAAQEAQHTFMQSDQMAGRGARQVTAEEIGYKP